MMTLKESLKQELHKPQTPFWQTATPAQRAAKWRESVAQSGTTSPNLPDWALRRESIYGE